MESFLRSIKTSLSDRDTILRDSLIANLVENVKELQYEFSDVNKVTEIEEADIKSDTDSTTSLKHLELCESTNSLCTTIEAIFLHGLKESFVLQTMSMIAGEIDHRPQPNFISVLLIFSHKNIIDEIKSLSQINTDIGFCRAWIRQCLNDGLLSSYLTNIRRNSQALKTYYRNEAFLRDCDKVEMAQHISAGLESSNFLFSLPCNSSLLNQWTYHPLQMAGIYTPPLRSCPIVSGEDVASSLYDPITNDDSGIADDIATEAISVVSSSSSTTAQTDSQIVEPPILSEIEKLRNHYEETFKIDLDKSSDDNHSIKALLEKVEQIEREKQLDEEKEEAINQSVKRKSQPLPPPGNNLNSKMGWSSSSTNDDNDNETNIQQSKLRISLSRANSMAPSISSMQTPIDLQNYNTLFDKHISKSVDFNDLWDRFETSLNISDTNNVIGLSNSSNCLQTLKDVNSNKTELHKDDLSQLKSGLGFEVIESPELRANFSLPDLQQMVIQSCRLVSTEPELSSTETGIEAQNFMCKSCSNPIGSSICCSAAATVNDDDNDRGDDTSKENQMCAFTGAYYCDKCISLNDADLCIIPARVIYNWDFKKYSVSKIASKFLTGYQYQPYLDFKLLNPKIYETITEMSVLQKLRTQLNFIRAYLITCSPDIFEQLQKFLWSKEYMYDHIHRYSIADLYLIRNCQLASQLSKAVIFGRDHIVNCPLCSQKGFFCELCNLSNVLYPFDIDCTYRCEICSAVFHIECLDATKPCPKCERRKRRDELLPINEVLGDDGDDRDDIDGSSDIKNDNNDDDTT